jgi:hypothetical protein
VTTEADSPGVLISTEVMVPPYIVPAYIAASMMMPEVGSMPKVSGSSSATPEGGPDARQRADQHADQHARHRHHEVERREARSRSPAEVRQKVQKHSLRHRNPQPVDEDQPVEP